MRIGLIGFGAFHAQTLAALPTVREPVITDVLASAAERVAKDLVGAVPVTVVPTPDDLLAAAPATDPAATFPGGEQWDFFVDRFAAAFRTELAAFTDVVAGDRASPCTLQDARKDVGREPFPG